MNVFHDIGMHVKSNKEKASLKCAAGKVSTVKRSEDLSNKEYVLFCSVLWPPYENKAARIALCIVFVLLKLTFQ